MKKNLSECYGRTSSGKGIPASPWCPQVGEFTLVDCLEASNRLKALSIAAAEAIVRFYGYEWALPPGKRDELINTHVILEHQSYIYQSFIDREVEREFKEKSGVIWC